MGRVPVGTDLTLEVTTSGVLATRDHGVYVSQHPCALRSCGAGHGCAACHGATVDPTKLVTQVTEDAVDLPIPECMP